MSSSIVSLVLISQSLNVLEYGLRVHPENIDSCVLKPASFIMVGDGLSDLLTGAARVVGRTLGVPMAKYWECDLLVMDYKPDFRPLTENTLTTAVYPSHSFWVQPRTTTLQLCFMASQQPTSKDLLKIIQSVADKYRFTTTLVSHL
jgi:hypothetical protein